MTDKPIRITHKAFKELRQSLGLNIDESAAVLCVGRDTIRMWEGGKKRKLDRRAHPCAVAYLECIVENPELVPPNWPERLLEN